MKLFEELIFNNLVLERRVTSQKIRLPDLALIDFWLLNEIKQRSPELTP